MAVKKSGPKMLSMTRGGLGRVAKGSIVGRPTRSRVLALPQPRQGLCRGRRVGAVQHDLLQRDKGGLGEEVGIGVQMGLKRGVIGGHDLGPAFGQELHLHLQPPTDHGIVAVQPEGQRLAHVDLFADGRVDDLGQFRLAGRTPPGRLELGHQAPGVVGRDDDGILRLDRRAVIQRGIKPEDHRTQQQEVNQRFLEDRLHPSTVPASKSHQAIPTAQHASFCRGGLHVTATGQ